ncbi:hypothetical protein [Methanoplanus limicola]|uniref:Putative PAS/PAC sensor protein n=1 Tax=Methanoplanus limicola DSM 2279 TaxID=937775 RepID=H1YWJ6_9EURY|nr:hypothetical protein [Methanoplanus limicola]EHQ35798.1 putative PAS/PAC sensor protein [Methanoplanus limicola DSM 2279]
MEITQELENILKNSDYAGEYTYNNMLGYVFDNNLSAIILSEINDTGLLLISDGGEIEGAVFVDKFGVLYGDKALYKLDKSLNFRVFVIEDRLASAVISRARIYKDSILKEHIDESAIPHVGNFGVEASKVIIYVYLNNNPAEGARVIMKRKGRSSYNHATTSSSGIASFLIPKGDYLCTVMIKYRTDFKTKLAVTGPDESFRIDL